MTSWQGGLSSTRPHHELHSPPLTPSDNALPDILARLGGKFAADIADILEKQTSQSEYRQVTRQPEPIQEDKFSHQHFALARIRAGNVEGAIQYIERHASELSAWLHTQIQHFVPHHMRKKYRSNLSTSPQQAIPTMAIVPDTVLIDAEAGRIAHILGQFGVFRAWAYAHSIQSGCGWIERSELEQLWRNTQIATSKRHARRVLQRGIQQGYWTQDKATKRIYLIGQIKLAAQLVQTEIEAGFHHLIETNKPGKKRVTVNLSGTSQAACARLYAAWLVAKDPDKTGTTISRDMLCDLWQVSVPTLLAWEQLAGIGKQANFAQSNDTSLENVPDYAYLTLNRDGSHAAAWRLPNTYFVNDKHIQQHTRTGKATHVKQAIRREIAISEQRGSIGDAALPRSGKRYFTDDVQHKVDAFKACNTYLRKLSRKGGDVFQKRYFYVGERHRVRIFEPFNIATNTRETNIHQRLIWQEGTSQFIAARQQYRQVVEEFATYSELFA